MYIIMLLHIYSIHTYIYIYVRNSIIITYYSNILDENIWLYDIT